MLTLLNRRYHLSPTRTGLPVTRTFLGDIRWERKRRPRLKLTPAQAEKQTKEAAKKRQIVIELTEEQLSALTEQWKTLSPAEAAELVFTVEKRPILKNQSRGIQLSWEQLLRLS